LSILSGFGLSKDFLALFHCLALGLIHLLGFVEFRLALLRHVLIIRALGAIRQHKEALLLELSELLLLANLILFIQLVIG
jgi:hypothetical protein